MPCDEDAGDVAGAVAGSDCSEDEGTGGTGLVVGGTDGELATVPGDDAVEPGTLDAGVLGSAVVAGEEGALDVGSLA